MIKLFSKALKVKRKKQYPKQVKNYTSEDGLNICIGNIYVWD